MASRSRSRSPIKRSQSQAGSDRASPTPSSTSGTSTATKKYQLLLNSIPLYWNYRQVSGYVKKHTNPIDKAIAEDMGYIVMFPDQRNPDTQQASITFKSESSRQQAFEELKASFEKVDGRKLYVKKKDVKPYTKNFVPKPKFISKVTNKPFRFVSQHLIDINGEDNETYGLSASYLEEMGITSRPLTRWVFVRGLPEEYNNESKVREVFRRAGIIVSAAIIESKGGDHYNARIEYDHPVEAVQCVSMYNNKEVLGCHIKCEMDFLRKKDFVDGVTQGPGLGPDGTPMRGIRILVECKKVKNELMQEIRKINDSLEELKAQVTNLFMEVENVKVDKKSAPVVQNTPNQNVSNPLAALGNILTNQLQPILLQGLMQQSTGNDMNALGNLLQNLTGGNMNLSNLLQQAQSGANIQAVSSFQSGPDMQGGLNNMQAGPSNILVGPNNMQGGQNNTHGGHSNMQGGPNIMQGGPNIMQGGPNIMQGGPSTMQGGPSNMQGVPNIMQGGPNNMQGGPNKMQGGPSHMQGGRNMQMGPNSCDPFGNNQSGQQNQSQPNSFNQMNNAGFNMPNQPNHLSKFSSIFEPNNQTKSSKQRNRCFKCGEVGHKAYICQKNKNNIQTEERRPGFDLKHCQKCLEPGHLANECHNNSYHGPNQNQNNNQQQLVGNSAMLLFKNLPPAVTHQILRGKMLEVGEVKLVEMTGPGRALVSFCYDQDADKCIRLFNESKVDGQTILVKRV